MTHGEAVSQRISELVRPYLRVERSPGEGEWIRVWFGPHCWLDIDRPGFERALQRSPLPLDADGRVAWP